MKKKLTLTIDEQILHNAISYARATGQSLSELVEKHLHTLTVPHSASPQLSIKLKQIAGAVKLPSDFDEKVVLSEYFRNKHR